MLYLAEMQGYETPHEAITALDEGVASGKFKPCAHLCYTLSGSSFEVIRFYYPACKKDCFVSPDPWHQEMGCPSACRLFLDSETAVAVQNELYLLEQRVESRKRFWHRVGLILASPFVYFRSLPSLGQSQLIILLIVWKLPKLKDTIIEILKAISGK